MDIWRNCSIWRTNDQIMPGGEGGGVSQNVFSSNLNTVNLKIFANMVEYSLEDKVLIIL